MKNLTPRTASYSLLISYGLILILLTNAALLVSAHEMFSAGSFRLATPVAVDALAGDLDVTFGVDGTVQTDFGNNLNDSAQGAAVQPDGKVITVGYVTTPANGKDFAITRLNTNGTPDTGFNGNGKLSFNFNSAARDDIAKAVAVQSDGKIIVAGYADVLGFGNFDVAVARLNANGTLDATFGSSGKVTTNLPNNRADYGNAVALQADGKIVVAGYSNQPTTGEDFVVVRYNANGTLDTSFNSTGIVITDILTNRADRAHGLALQTDGKIIAAGYTNDPSFANNFVVVRYDTNGALDTTFNGTGKVNTDLNLNSMDVGNAVTLQSDGKIVVAGESSADFGVVRYNPDGSLDVGFGGGDGMVTTNFGTNATDIGRGVIVHNDGKITVAGRSRTELACAQYNTDGTLVNSFGRNGLLIQNAGNNQLSGFGGYWGIALQSDGKFVAAGDGWRDVSANDFTVSRINANGTFDFTFNGGDGIASTDFAGRYDEATDIAVQPDGKIIAAGRATDATGANQVALARYNVNGTLDTSFDADGLVTTDLAQYSSEDTQALALQPDGKMIVAGSAKNPTTLLNDAYLIRYNANGSLDSSFGTGGIVITLGNQVAEGNVWLYPYDIVLQPNGKIVVAGLADYISVYGDGYVARYNANGSLDATFLTNVPNHTVNGSVVVNFANNYNVLNAVALQSDGKIVVAGWTNEASPDLTVARLNTNGALDTSFDGDGKLTTDFGNNTGDFAYDVDIQPDGKIVAVGRTNINQTDMAAARYNPNGSLDTTFGGGDGKINIDFGTFGDTCTAVAFQPDGKIILGGVSEPERFLNGYTVVKLTPSGAFDTSFGGGTGRAITTLGEGVGTGLGMVVNDMVLQPNGRVLLAGTCAFNSTDRDFTLVRYENSNISRARFDFDGDGKSDTSVFRPSSGLWYLLQSQAGFSGVPFGVSGDAITPADYDGDGRTDVAVFRPSNGYWYLQRSTSGFTAVQFGASGDLPRPGDYDGDGKADICIFRPSNGTWYFLNSSDGQFVYAQFGQSGDAPVIADFDGDRKSDLALYRPSSGSWYWLNSSNGQLNAVQFGASADIPVVGDYDGDGKSDLGVFRPSNGTWYLQESIVGFVGVLFGQNGDFPVADDYDGDGKTDVAVYRPATGDWYIQRSQAGFTSVQFGGNADKPIPSAFLP